MDRNTFEYVQITATRYRIREKSCIRLCVLLQYVKMKSSQKRYQSKIEFQSYGVGHGKERSGAYLFLPDGPARVSCSQ